MNTGQRDLILNALKTLETIDIDKLATEVYGAKAENTMIGQYTLLQFTDTIKKVQNRLKKEIEADGWVYLPFVAVVPELGQGELHVQLASITAQLKSKQFAPSATHLTWVVYYLMLTGIWRKSKVAEIEQEFSNIEAMRSRYELLEKHLEKNKDTITTLTTQLDEKKKELDTFKANKEKELQQVAALLATAQQQNNQIASFVTNSSTNNEKVKGIVNSLDTALVAMQKKQEEEKAKFDEFIKKQSELIGTLDAKTAEIETMEAAYSEKLKFIEGKESYILEKEKEITELTGFAAGVSLFHTFDQRKKQLRMSVRIWGAAVPLAVGVTLWGIALIFKYNPIVSNAIVDWGIVLGNAVKASPLIFLLYFVIRQYSRERGFQEEYAFKSSVALTINAYADKLQQQDNKEKLIMDSVEKVYQTPLTMKDKGMNIVSFRARGLNETLKTINETVKEIREKK